MLESNSAGSGKRKEEARMLKNYDDFLKRVNKLGYMFFSEVLPGLPCLTGETLPEQWHTGDMDTDPWWWKDRAAEEKKLAFGCVLGGHKGFVSPEMYPYFYRAFHPEEHIEERRYNGEVKEAVWDLWQLFQRKTLMSTSDIRNELGVSKKKGTGRIDSAIKELQQHFYIAVSGSTQKKDRLGQPYGWRINVYDKTLNWAPTKWMEKCSGLSVGEAQNTILKTGAEISRNVTEGQLAKVLGIK
ncbi:MAG TPA: hypothetical protein VHT34_01285 [Clostridia bacterium]|nr:hypothetical protein [Clostridia bacterium]